MAEFLGQLTRSEYGDLEFMVLKCGDDKSCLAANSKEDGCTVALLSEPAESLDMESFELRIDKENLDLYLELIAAGVLKVFKKNAQKKEGQ
jgi:hypothetical protein